MRLSRSWFTPFLLTIVALSALSLPSVASAAPSPTGRSPRLMWTAERQDVWNRMRADFLANQSNPQTLGGRWFKLVKDNAECGCRYNDTGLWATLMYQWTGETRYVDLAWTKLSGFMALSNAETSGNYVREYGTEYVMLLDWLWPGLNQQRRDQLTASVANMLNNALTGNPNVDGYQLGDSDQTVGTYFGVLAFYLAFPTHPLASVLFSHPKTGGFTATGVDQATARNAIKLYVTSLAEGGEWIESSEYNLGTVRLLLMGAEAVRTGAGVDHFPEITQWTQRHALGLMAAWTPDLKATYQWGDLEHPRYTEYYSWTNSIGMTAGLLQGTPQGAQLQQQLLDLVARYGAVGSNTMEPIVTGRIFLTFNPYAPTANWRTDKTFYAPGAGLLLQKSGFGATDSMFSAHVAPRRNGNAVDHLVRYLNDFELWRNGEWALTHPRGYQGAPNGGLGTNSVLMHGFSDMWGHKAVTAQSSGETHAFLQGTTGGSSVQPPYYDPPPVFVHEWTRSVLYLPGATDTVVVFDRTHVDSTVQRLDRYYQDDRNLISRAPAPKQWLLHMPVSPSISSTNVGWSTPGGQAVRWTPLLPAGSTKTTYDEAALDRSGLWGGYKSASELKFQVRVSPATVQPWDTFLNVVQVGTPGAITLRSVPGQVEGAHITRPGGTDVLALFNATPSARLTGAAFDPSHQTAVDRAHFRSSGFSLSWTAQAGSTEVFLADLDPTRQWVVMVDGARVNGFTPSAGGFGRFMASGAGSHTLNVTVAGQASVAPSAPNGLRIVR